MKLFESIRKNRAKRQLIRALEIISKLSWEELDSILPRTDYSNCFAFNKEDWEHVELTHLYVPVEKGGEWNV